MPIKLAISGRSPVTFTDAHIALGSDPTCALAFPEAPGVKPVHAVIKEIGGKWLIEACEDDPLIVGNGKPGRMHWLNPGDVIQISDSTPPVIFQPPGVDDDDDFLLPLNPRFANSSAPFLPVKEAAPLTEEVSLSDTVEISQSPSSTSIPTLRKLTSEKPAASKSRDSIPAAKRSSSGTMKPASPAGDKGERSSDPAQKSSRSDAEIPASRPKRSRSNSQTRVPKPVDDEIDESLPVLERISSYDDLEPAPRRGRSKDKDELQWIVSIVGKCLAGGAVLLVAWLLISTVWKAIARPSADLPVVQVGAELIPGAATGTAPSATTAPAAAYVPPRPKTNPLESVNSKAAVTTSDENSKVKETAESATTVGATEGSATAVAGEAGNEIESTEGEKVADDDSMDGLPEDADSTDPVDLTANDDMKAGILSPSAEKTTESVYAIVMENRDRTEKFQIGTAWAASPQHLVTSGSVASAINLNLKKGMTAVAVQPATWRTVRINRVRINGTYLKAVDAADDVTGKRLTMVNTAQLRFNLAVLDIEPKERLESYLPLVSKPLKTTKETVYTMVGFPLENNDPKATTLSEVAPLQECISKRLPAKNAAQGKDQGLSIKFLPQSTERDWSGSPVLNKENEVIGVYAQLPPAKSADGKKSRREHTVVWIGLLREFAPDVEKNLPADDR